MLKFSLQNLRTQKEKLLNRKAQLLGGVAVLSMSARATEPEMKQKKQLFEDSLNSTQAALEGGQWYREEASPFFGPLKPRKPPT
jgi:chaperonin GroEL (HSP60 family)